MFTSFELFAGWVGQWADGLMILLDDWGFSLDLGYAILAFLYQFVFALSVTFVLVLPFLVIWLVIKSFFR